MTSPADRVTGRTSRQEQGAEHGADGTPPVLWIAVGLMCLGAALIGIGVVLLDRDTTSAVVAFIAGGAVGLVGGVLSLANGIMSNVEYD